LAEQEGNPGLAGQPLGEPRAEVCGLVDNGNLCKRPDYYVTCIVDGRGMMMFNRLIINEISRISADWRIRTVFQEDRETRNIRVGSLLDSTHM
jgi:hypothetical protein